ncbi:hypothetical protein GUJ93_ZPchr0005g14813 [Zizania palustris]|uniref:Uncharacterized protein n=1 Tax=Zizania palustris TaxID=103762 RepID=A0A8J5W190_ZIZPA|nr:hypothetical protein GUJ93_ZPchr0005g14813 [Zizania palustris]
MLELTPPPLMDWVPQEKGPKKRVAEAGASSSAKTPVKKVARKPKNLAPLDPAPSSSRTSLSGSKEDEGILLVKLIDEDAAQRSIHIEDTAGIPEPQANIEEVRAPNTQEEQIEAPMGVDEAEVPVNVPESGDNADQPMTSVVQEDTTQAGVPVDEGGVEVTMALILEEVTRTLQDDAPTVQDLAADSDEDYTFDPPISPVLDIPENVEGKFCIILINFCKIIQCVIFLFFQSLLLSKYPSKIQFKDLRRLRSHNRGLLYRGLEEEKDT